jgi:hypothetical protein
MSRAFRTYRGLHGEPIRVPADSFATVPKLHAEPQPFPFARMAAELGPQRDRFALAVNRAGLFEEALMRADVRSIRCR